MKRVESTLALAGVRVFHSVIFSDSGWPYSKYRIRNPSDNDGNLLSGELNITKNEVVCQPEKTLAHPQFSLLSTNSYRH